MGEIMDKNDIVKRLTELEALLGREIKKTGTVAVLEVLLRESEEEYAAMSEESGGDGSTGEESLTGVGGDLNTSGAAFAGGVNNSTILSAAADVQRDLVVVKTLVTLHVDALHETLNQPVSIAVAGTVIRLDAVQADELEDLGYVAFP
jgi:hypothetical protein